MPGLRVGWHSGLQRKLNALPPDSISPMEAAA
jgi:hypothetical protein